MYMLLLRHGTIRTFLKVYNKPINAHFLQSLATELEMEKMDDNMMILVDRTNQNIDGKRGISTHQR